METPTPDKKTMLVEYSAAQMDYIHNDKFPWNIGTILVAGAFIFWGIIIGSPDEKMDLKVLGVASSLVSLLLSTWIFFFHHYRQTAIFKLDRMYEIEKELNMESHIRWYRRGGKIPRYKNFGPSGHTMALFVYAFTSLGAVIIGFFKNNLQLSLWLLPPVILTVLSIIIVMCQEKRLNDRLDQSIYLSSKK